MKYWLSLFSLSLVVGVLAYACSTNKEIPDAPIPPQYSLTVSAGEGGTVTPEATGSYAEGTTITLSATPDEGYDFDRWVGSDFDDNRCAFARYCRTAVTMNSNRNVEAFFQPISD